MKALYVFCEGPTEQGFCDKMLFPHLFPQCDREIHTIKIAHSKHHGIVRRGGVGKYASLRRDITNNLNSRKERDVCFTTLIDLYGLPAEFPGKADLTRNPNDPRAYATALERAFGTDIDDIRFIPHLQLHEYEAMLFADPEAFRWVDNCDNTIAQLHQIAAAFPTPEHIDDGLPTAPSKRIIDLLPRYADLKVTAGPDIAALIGLDAIRGKCPHFAD